MRKNPLHRLELIRLCALNPISLGRLKRLFLSDTGLVEFAEKKKIYTTPDNEKISDHLTKILEHIQFVCSCRIVSEYKDFPLNFYYGDLEIILD